MRILNRNYLNRQEFFCCLDYLLKRFFMLILKVNVAIVTDFDLKACGKLRQI